MGDVSTFVLIELERHGQAASSVHHAFHRAIGDAGGSVVAALRAPADDRAVLAAAFVSAMTALRALLSLRSGVAGTDTTARLGLWTAEPGVGGGPADERALAWWLEVLPDSEPGRTVANAATAVVVGPALPADVELVDLGSRSAGPGGRAERLYELARVGAEVDQPGRGAGDEPVPASNLTWAHRAAPGPVSGRDDMLARVDTAWQGALRGQRRAVVLHGESGMGKTALAAETALRAHAAGAVVLYGRWDRERIAYQGFREALGAYARDCPTDRLRQQLEGRRAPIRILLPDADARLAARPAMGRGDPEGRRLELYTAVSDWLDLLAADRPVLMVLDDLHWAEQSSLLLWDSLVHAASRAPWMLLATARLSTDAAPLLGQESGCDHIRLTGLDAAGVAGLAEQTLGRALPADSPAITRLASDTAGNPLLVLQILRSLGDASDVEAALRRVRERLPTRLVDVVQWRLSQLPARSRELLADAAVVGATVDVELVASAAKVPPVVLDQALEPAVEEALLRPDALRYGYVFTHEVIRRSLSEGVEDARRALLHRRTAAALEERVSRGGGSDDIPPSRVADHYLLGADAATVDAAVRWARRGAAAACEATGFDEAVHLLSRAIDVEQRFGRDPVAACELRLELAEALDLAGQFAARDRRYLEAADRARDLDRTDLFVRAALGYGGSLPAAPIPDPSARALVEEALDRLPITPTGERARALSRLAHVRHLEAPYELRRELADEAIALARSLEEPVTLATVLVDRCLALDGLAGASDGLAAGREVAAIGRRLDRADLQLKGLRLQASTLMADGRYAEAQALAETHARLAHEVRHQDGLRLAAMWDVFTAVREGRYADCEALVTDLVAELDRAGHAQAPFIGFAFTLVPRWLHGELERSRPTIETVRAHDPGSVAWWALSLWVDTYTGGEGRARHELDQHDPADVIARIGRDFMWWPTVLALSVAVSVCHDRRWAKQLYDVIEPYGGRLGLAGYVLCAGAVDHHLGTLALVLDRRSDAIGLLRSGLASHRSLDAPSFVALSAGSLASALTSGDPTPEESDEAMALTTEADELRRRLGLAGVHGAPTFEDRRR